MSDSVAGNGKCGKISITVTCTFPIIEFVLVYVRNPRISLDAWVASTYLVRTPRGLVIRENKEQDLKEIGMKNHLVTVELPWFVSCITSGS